MKLELKKIRTDGRTQPREVLNEDVITEYAEAMRRGDKFPMVDVFYDGKDYWLADGFHRVGAARRANLKKIEAKIHRGTLRDAILFSCGANAQHGQRRTNADKRRAVLKLLKTRSGRSGAIRKWQKGALLTKAMLGQSEKTYLRLKRLPLDRTEVEGNDMGGHQQRTSPIVTGQLGQHGLHTDAKLYGDALNPRQGGRALTHLPAVHGVARDAQNAGEFLLSGQFR